MRVQPEKRDHFREVKDLKRLQREFPRGGREEGRRSESSFCWKFERSVGQRGKRRRDFTMSSPKGLLHYSGRIGTGKNSRGRAKAMFIYIGGQKRQRGRKTSRHPDEIN